MALRTAHGKARKRGRKVVVETLPLDEMPKGEPGPSPVKRPAAKRGRKFSAGDPSTREAARAGGKARRHRTELAATLGVSSEDPEVQRRLRQADALRVAQCRVLASTVGGGTCGPVPSVEVGSGALKVAFSRLAFSGGDIATGSRLATEARQHFLTAHELCAREAEARAKAEQQAAYQTHETHVDEGAAPPEEPEAPKPYSPPTDEKVLQVLLEMPADMRHRALARLDRERARHGLGPWEMTPEVLAILPPPEASEDGPVPAQDAPSRTTSPVEAPRVPTRRNPLPANGVQWPVRPRDPSDPTIIALEQRLEAQRRATAPVTYDETVDPSTGRRLRVPRPT
jgi:hypothetical protein